MENAVGFWWIFGDHRCLSFTSIEGGGGIWRQEENISITSELIGGISNLV